MGSNLNTNFRYAGVILYNIFSVWILSLDISLRKFQIFGSLGFGDFRLWMLNLYIDDIFKMYNSLKKRNPVNL